MNKCARIQMRVPMVIQDIRQISGISLSEWIEARAGCDGTSFCSVTRPLRVVSGRWQIVWTTEILHGNNAATSGFLENVTIFLSFKPSAFHIYHAQSIQISQPRAEVAQSA